MATRLENLHRKSKDIVDERTVLDEKKQSNIDNRGQIKSIIDSFNDDSDIGLIGNFENALVGESAAIEGKQKENNRDRLETLADTDEYLEHLEENLSKFQEMKRITDLKSSEDDSIQSTQRRIGELHEIKELLDGEESSSTKGGIELRDEAAYGSIEDRRSTFLESLKVQVEPSVPTRHEEDIYIAINTADKQQLVQIIKDNKLAQDADFGNLDNEVARQMVKSVYETKKRFDFIDMNFIGSIQARNHKIAGKLFDIYMTEYQRLNPEWSREELKPFVDKLVKEHIDKIEPAPNTMAQSVFVEHPTDVLSLAASYVGGISINESYGSDYKSFTEVKVNEVRIGHKPVGCETVKATIDHELGHQIANKLNACNDADIKEIYNRFSNLSGIEQANALSTYAAKNIGEFVAECWSEYSNNPQCRKVAALVSKRLIDLYEAEEIGPKILERGFSR